MIPVFFALQKCQCARWEIMPTGTVDILNLCFFARWKKTKQLLARFHLALSPMATPPVKRGDVFGPLLSSTLQSIHGGISHLLGLNTNEI